MTNAKLNQAMIWTVLPVDSVVGANNYLDLSVIVSPRLESSTSDQVPLTRYADWSTGGTDGRTWPDTIAALAHSFEVGLHGIPITASVPGPRSYPAKLVHNPVPGVLFGSQQPDADLWTTMFGPDTKTMVTPYVFQGMETRRIKSAPVGTLSNTINTLYGQHGLTSPTEFPTYTDLMKSTSIAPFGFNDSAGAPSTVGTRDQDGYQRRKKLLSALDTALTANRAVPYDTSTVPTPGVPSNAATAAALAFLEAQEFLRRPQQVPVPAVDTNPQWDFHQLVGAAASLPSLMRALGLVIDLRVGPIPTAVIDKWESLQNSTDIGVSLLFNKTKLVWQPASTPPDPHENHLTNTVTPQTASLVSKAYFRPKPLHVTSTDLESGMLKLGDEQLFTMVRVDHDDAALKVMQLADNVSRSRNAQGKLTDSTPDRFALPALRTGGFAIAKSGRAEQMAATLQRQTAKLQDGYFTSPATTPPLHAEDITRGYRFDIFCKQQTDSWLSLMWRQGTIQVGTADPLTLTVLEEDTVVPAPTTAGVEDPTMPSTMDLYLQETLTKWDGWSLAVPRLGLPLNSGMSGAASQGSTGFNVTTSWQVPGSRATTNVAASSDIYKLPPLRFGQKYQMRARAVDLAGNSLSMTDAPSSPDSDLVTPPLTHLRFEPIPAPRMLLTALPGAGGSEEVMVIRSESGADQTSGGIDTATDVRMLAPGASSIFMAEQHGKFDIPDPDTASEQEMDGSSNLHDLLAKADATDLADLGELSDPSLVHSASNPYLFPDFMPITYLPEAIGPAALVRSLPINANKSTVARLPFDAIGAGWPNLQAARITLVKGSTTWTASIQPDQADDTVATAELLLTLDVGDMYNCEVNCSITKAQLANMALWEQIQIQAAAAGLTTKQINTLAAAIEAGEHWMFTPWRNVVFIHAVRTPLQKPVLFLAPTKSSIGQSYADFKGLTNLYAGTVEMSRKSTARIDVNGTWSMPIDTGTNVLTVDSSTFSGISTTPFAGHAFGFEIERVGEGTIPAAATKAVTSVNAENFHETHEFNDTRFRAVNYQGTATSYYVEYFREQLTLSSAADPIADLRSMGQVAPGVAFEGSTVKLFLVGTDDTDPSDPKIHTLPLVPAPVGTDPDAPAPTPGDYIVVEDSTLNTASDPTTATAGYIQILTNSTINSGQVSGTPTVVFSYVGPTIHTFSDPIADKTTSSTMIVPNSKRPTAPSPLYVIPISNRGTPKLSRTSQSITWTRNAHRVYLNRPWWSSGDKERLGVVCWHAGHSTDSTPPADLSPYVTQWGFDPIHQSNVTLTGATKQPTPACFPLATSSKSSGALSIEEVSDNVDVAGHSVQYDADRDLWFADIKITSPSGTELESYTPFIRFALARYQPNSIDDAYLSKVVTVDYAQIAPNRHLTLTGNATEGYTVTVVGFAPIDTSGAKPAAVSKIRVTLEAEDNRIADTNLTWVPVIATTGGVSYIELTPSLADTDKVTWTGTIQVRATGGQARLTIEEFEVVGQKDEKSNRLVFTDSILVATPRT